MAEYRELPMVPASARRSDPKKYKATDVYTLNKGHVLFFFNKKRYLLNRWLELIAELYARGYKIDPSARTVHWSELDKFPQVEWRPTLSDQLINQQRLIDRINKRPNWYRIRGQKLNP